MGLRLRGDDEMLFMKCSPGVANLAKEFRRMILRGLTGKRYLYMKQHFHLRTSVLSEQCCDNAAHLTVHFCKHTF